MDPDCVRAIKRGTLRNPYSIRPYQHVLEPVCAYLMVAQRQYEDASLQGNYNIGPDNCDCVTTGTLADLFCKYWGEEAHWINLSPEGAPHEAAFSVGLRPYSARHELAACMAH